MRTLLIDDERNFLDGRPATVIRSSWKAVEHFSNEDGSLKNVSYDEVWLDYSLTGSDSIDPFIQFARKSAAFGKPLKVREFVVHTSSWAGANLIKQTLDAGGYRNRRFDLTTQNPKVIS